VRVRALEGLAQDGVEGLAQRDAAVQPRHHERHHVLHALHALRRRGCTAQEYLHVRHVNAKAPREKARASLTGA
jgi:hypothetical protein